MCENRTINCSGRRFADAAELDVMQSEGDMKIEGLRSGYDSVEGIVFFGRMLDKIRLYREGSLPDDYNLGHGLDNRVCQFLRIEYDSLVTRTLVGGSDEEILELCFEEGYLPSDEEIFVFNAFMKKRGWRDETSDWVTAEKERLDLLDRDDIQTCFDIHDAEEGRPRRSKQSGPRN